MTDIHTKIAIAREFGLGIQEALSRAEFREMIDRNKAEDNPSVCHTHDYVDANVYMGEAFETVMKREMRVDSDEDAEIWNDAWTIAKDADFYA